MRRLWIGAAVVACSAASLAQVACRNDRDEQAAEFVHGSPTRGARIIRTYGCGSCHTIPGIEGASATVGPPLAGIASRSYIAGVLTNEPDNMVRWLLDPPAVDSNTAMPKVGLSTQQARDVASYLYTLR